MVKRTSPAAQKAPARPRKPMKISSLAADTICMKRGPVIDAYEAFKPYEPAKGVLPDGKTAKLAMDEAGFDAGMWGAAGMFSGAFQEGQVFPGYPELALWAQRPEYRLITETRATEMTRKWIKLTIKGDGDDDTERTHEKIAKIEAEFRRLQVRDRFREVAVKDGFFGRGHLYLDTGHSKEPEELKVNLGNGRDATSRVKVSTRNPLQWLTIVEPMWAYPNVYNSTNPLERTWYRPDQWYVMGTPVHVSRLLLFVSQEVPDILKPAYAFGDRKSVV